MQAFFYFYSVVRLYELVYVFWGCAASPKPWITCCPAASRLPTFDLSEVLENRPRRGQTSVAESNPKPYSGFGDAAQSML